MSQYEQLVTEWIATVEATIQEQASERYRYFHAGVPIFANLLEPENKKNILGMFKFVDLKVANCRLSEASEGPLSELDKWRKRWRLLTLLTDQLKSRECKTVLSVLVTAKSRLVKKWKVADSGYDNRSYFRLAQINFHS